MIKIPQSIRDAAADDEYFSECCHSDRPDGHECSGYIQWEHPWKRQHGMVKIFVPVCSSMNYSPSKKARAYSMLKAFEIYTREYFMKCNPKFKYDEEYRLAKSFFPEL